ncbi:methyltransferase domain-containing protein [Patescibacteria group bacterium]|nr:methyltransferase domain-containing protein [Patescibacteria group bacterium]
MKRPSVNWIKRYYGSDHYFLWYSQQGYFDKTREEVDFIVSQTVRSGCILDVGCGQGRHCLEFTKRGFEAVGIDTSQKLIRQARQAGKGLPARFILDDARKMSKVKGCFDLAVLLFSSFGLHSHADNYLVIRETYARLKIGGYLFIDMDNVHEIKRYVAKAGGVYTNGDFTERIVFNPATNMVRWNESWRGQVYSGRYQLYTSEQLSRILEGAGLQVKRLFGSFQGEEYSTKSRRLIIVAVKP